MFGSEVIRIFVPARRLSPMFGIGILPSRFILVIIRIDLQRDVFYQIMRLFYAVIVSANIAVIVFYIALRQACRFFVRYIFETFPIVSVCINSGVESRRTFFIRIVIAASVAMPILHPTVLNTGRLAVRHKSHIVTERIDVIVFLFMANIAHAGQNAVLRAGRIGSLFPLSPSVRRRIDDAFELLLAALVRIVEIA